MKNKLSDLQTHLFELIEDLMDSSDLNDEDMDRKIKHSLAVNEIAKTAVANGSLMAKCVDILYGIPVSDEVPLLPKAEDKTFIVADKKKALIAVPRDDGAAGYVRGRQQPV